MYFEPHRAIKLRNLHLTVRGAVEGFISGLHKSPHKGFSVEFSEHREYTPGDDPRHLDWVAWAKTDRYYVKQYEQETNLRAYILLDVSNSMNYRHSGGITKFTYGAYLSACLGYLICRQQDVVGMMAFDRDVRWHIPPGSSPAHIDRIFRRLEGTTCGNETSIAPTFHKLAQMLSRRGVVIIISDLYDEPSHVLKALQHFVHKRHQVIVMHLLDKAEIEFPFKDMTSFVDLETNERVQVDPLAIRDEYVRQMREFVATWRRECGQRRIEYINVTTDTPYDTMLLDYLSRRKAMTR